MLRLTRLIFITGCYVAALSAQTGSTYYAAINGTPTGTGSASSPWDLATALAQPAAVKPGDMIWLRGGTYGTGGTTVFTSNLNGTSTAPIIVRQFPGERAIINGGIQVNGSYTWYWGFEIMNSSTNRTGTSTAVRSPGLFLVGVNGGNKAINMIIHDTGHPGIQFNDQSDQGEVYGTLAWGNGVYDTAQLGGTPTNPVTRGDGIYAQNLNGNTYISDSIFMWNFTYGIKAYAEGGSVNGFRINGNLVLENGFRGILAATHTSGAPPVKDLQLTNNMAYQTQYGMSTLHAGYANLNTDAIITGNYLVGGNSGTTAPFNVVQFPTLTVQNNTSIGADLTGGLLAGVWKSGTQTNWDNNAYFGAYLTPFHDIYNNASWDFPGWKVNQAFDANSTYSPLLPTGVKVFVRPNAYEPNRGNVMIYNWDDLPAVSVDLSPILLPGTPYEIRDVQNYFGAPAATGTYSGGSISIPMNLSAITPLIGSVTSMPNLLHTAPRFAAFTVLPTTAPGQASAPIVTPNGGTFSGAVSVSMLSATSGAVIYYTTDGTTPTTASLVYSAPILVRQNSRIRAIAVKSGLTNSIVTPANFTITPDATPPVLSNLATSGLAYDTISMAWTTNEMSDTQIEYGTTTAFGMLSPLNSTLSTSHNATLNGLSPTTTYYYRARSRDLTGNLGVSATQTFTTPAIPDTTAPIISGWLATPTDRSATITFLTNERGTTEVTYGLTTALGSTTGKDPAMLTSHKAVIVSGLQPNTRYYYRMWSYDAAGNLGKTAHQSFNTLADTKPPVISGISATPKSNTATIAFTTNEPASCQVFYKKSTVTTFSSTAANTTLATSFSVPLASLTSNTLHNYYVACKDSAGNSAKSSTLNFTTLK